MKRFAEAAEAIAGERGKLAKVALLAAYLRTLEDDDLAPAARFFTGNPFPERSDMTLSVGGATIVAAARQAWGVTDARLSEAYRLSGDLGTALSTLIGPPADLGLFRTTLTPASLMTVLENVADSSGKSANRRRAVLLERALAACETPLEAKYLIKILTGELRIGLREGLILDGIAAAFDAPAADVRKAAMAAGDVGAVAVAAKHGWLDQIEIAYGSPIAFMLASPLQYGSEYRELQSAGPWIVEDKYDGVRIQAHKHGDAVRLFSRRLNETGNAWPEVVAALREFSGDVILDGEIVAVRGDSILPFRQLQSRLQRKDPTPDTVGATQVAYVVFDCLARKKDFLLDRPLHARREVLGKLPLDGRVVKAAPFSTLDPNTPAERLHERFASARARGNEGLLFKRSDSTYVPGKRGKAWLKLKRELDTLDAVVVAVEWGHGRRSQVLSDYTFALRGERGELLVIGKAYSGLTDAEIAEMTQWFLAHRLADAERAYAELGLSRYEIPVEPKVVVEIAFDVVHRSDLHKSGYALRFPRIVRLRPDKSPQDADPIARLREIYETSALV